MAREHYTENGKAVDIALKALERAVNSSSSEGRESWAKVAEAAARLVDATKG